MQKSKIRVAIIEDNRFMSQCLGVWLERQMDCTIAGYAEEGEAGLELCLKTRPDLALIDILIPKMDGITLVGKLLEVLPSTRLIVMSGLMDPFTIWRVWQSGVHAYILKSESLEFLEKAIRAVMDNGVFFSSAFQEVKNNWLSQPEAFQKILSDREQEVLRHVVAGWEDGKIAGKLGISDSTVAVHRKNILKKLDLHNDRELLAYALRWGLDGKITSS